jgi:hypothetical protein
MLLAETDFDEGDKNTRSTIAAKLQMLSSVRTRNIFIFLFSDIFAILTPQEFFSY